MKNTTVEEMLKYVARFAELRGSEEAFVDSRLPGCRRKKLNIIGSGVVERTRNVHDRRGAERDRAPAVSIRFTSQWACTAASATSARTAARCSP